MPSLPTNRRQAQADVGEPLEPIDIARHADDAPLVVENRLDDARDRQRDGVERGALPLDDFLSRCHHGAVDSFPRGYVQRGPARRDVTGHRDLPDARRAPHRHRRIAVLPDDVRVDAARVDRELAAEQVAESRGVEGRPGPDDFRVGRGKPLCRHVGEDVDRVGDHNHDRAAIVRRHAVEDLLEHAHVAARQVEPRLAGLASPSGGDHDHVGILDSLEPFRADVDVVEVGGAMGKVQGLAKRLLGIDVNQADAARQVPQEQGVGERRADVSSADDGDLHEPLPVMPIVLARSPAVFTRRWYNSDITPRIADSILPGGARCRPSSS